MFKYPELLRIKGDRIELRSDKNYADRGRVNKFLRRKNLVIEEKLDGSQMAVGFKGGAPYLQGKNSHIPMGDKRPQFNGTWDWIWDNLNKIEELQGYLVFGEWLRTQHYILYDQLPDWFIAFDVYDNRKKKFLPAEEKTEFLSDRNFSQVAWTTHNSPSLHVLEDLGELMSSYGEEKREGVLIKDYSKQEFIKYVRREFIDELDNEGHWTSTVRQRLNNLIDDTGEGVKKGPELSE